jgi:hypothetical protein
VIREKSPQETTPHTARTQLSDTRFSRSEIFNRDHFRDLKNKIDPTDRDQNFSNAIFLIFKKFFPALFKNNFPAQKLLQENFSKIFFRIKNFSQKNFTEKIVKNFSEIPGKPKAPLTP